MNIAALLKKLIRNADVVIEVVDARDISGTRIHAAERTAGTNRLIVIANKTDLLPKGTELRVPRKGLQISAKKADEKQRKALIRTILEKTSARPARVLVLGYPNVGKSSLINMLAQRKAAKVSSIAGTTKNVQWVKVSDELLATDYRGLYPEKEKKAELARKGAINVEHDAERYAYEAAEKILKSPKLKEWIAAQFDMDLEAAGDSGELLEAIAKRRNLYLKGGELNIHEAAKALLRAMREAPEM